MDSRPNRRNKAAFSNFFGVVGEVPLYRSTLLVNVDVNACGAVFFFSE